MYRNASGVSGERTRHRVRVASALAATNFQGNRGRVAGRRKVRDEEDVIASTRGRVRSPDGTFARRPPYKFVTQSVRRFSEAVAALSERRKDFREPATVHCNLCSDEMP